MSRAGRGIRRILAPLGIYRLGTGSMVDREIQVYDEAFASLEARMDEVFAQAFVQSAQGEALARFERLVGQTPRLSLADSTRRELVLYRMGVAPYDFHRAGILRSIRGAGMEADLVEDPAQEALTVRCEKILDSSLDLDGLKDGVWALLPAHLAIAFDLGELTWDLFQAARVSWETWDALDFTWVDFDLKGHLLFEQINS